LPSSPATAELDFKKLARAAGLRKAEMAPLKDVQAAYRLHSRRRDRLRGKEILSVFR